MSDPSLSYSKKSRSKVPLFIAVAVVVVIAALAAVFVFNKPSASTQGKQEITIGILLEPTNLNIRETAGVALDQVLADNIYEGLVGFKSGTLDLQPVLATEYEVSEDGKTYSFTIRENVKFHSGNTLTAADVVSSLSETLGESAEVSAAETGVVTIVLEEPNSQLLYRLAGREGLILEEAATNDLASSANGTGPFVFESWKQGDSITIVKNDNYWGEEATLDRAIFSYIPDDKAAVNASLDGKLDAQIAVTPSLRAEFDRSDNFDLVRAESTDVFTLAYNNQRPPLDNPRVRAALSQAIDASAIIAALEGDGKPLGGPITSLEPGFVDLTEINAFNLENAKKILEEEGVAGLKLEVTAPNFYDTVALEIVASQLARVGVTLGINQVEFGTWLEDVYTNKDYDLSYVDHAEGFDFGNYANPNYYFGFDNKTVQDLYAESLRSTDPDAAADLLEQASKVVAEEAVAKWLYNYTPTNAISKNVQNFPKGNTNSRINLAGVTMLK